MCEDSQLDPNEISEPDGKGCGIDFVERITAKLMSMFPGATKPSM